MKRYNVSALITVSAWTVVEADSADEALRIADDRSVGSLAANSIYPSVDKCWHFQNDGEPTDLEVEDKL